MKELFTKLLATLACSFFAVSLMAQIPNDSPIPVDVSFTVTATQGERSVEYWSVTNSTEWGIQPLRETVSAPLIWVDDDDLAMDGLDSLGCDTTSQADAYAGHIALIRRGSCFFSDKIFYAQNGGAIGVVIINAPDGTALGGMSAGDEKGLEITIPAIFMNSESGDFFLDELDSGGEVIATFAVRSYFGQLGPYAYSTPQSQILPMDEIQSEILNLDTANVLMDVMGTVEIEDPSGTVTTLTTMIDEIQPSTIDTFQFDDYIPSDVGIYSMTFTNSANMDTLTRQFEITDYTFAIDNNDIPAWPVDSWIAAGNDGFVEDNLRYDFGSFYLTGPDGAVATHVTFALGNPDSLFTGYEDADVFSILIYDADDDEDGVANTAATSYEDLGPVVGFGAYILDGTETEYQLLTVELDEPLTLKANGQYAVMVQYDGINAGLGIPPWFLYAGTDAFPYLDNLVFTDQLYTGGWAGGFNGVIRLHLDGFTVGVDDIQTLDETKINLMPNPASNLVQLQFDLDAVADQVTVAMLDITGKVLQLERYNNIMDNTLEFDVNKYPAGTYFFAIQTPEGYRTKKFVVVK